MLWGGTVLHEFWIPWDARACLAEEWGRGGYKISRVYWIYGRKDREEGFLRWWMEMEGARGGRDREEEWIVN